MKVLAFGTTVFIAVALASGCSSEHSTTSSSQSQAIQGGTLDTTDGYAVGVCAGGPGQCQLFCSGALIAPNLVMTARHCVNQPSSQSIDCASTVFGGQYTATSNYYITTNSSMNQGSIGWHQAKTIWTTPGTKVCGNDMALIELKTNVALSEVGQFVTPVVQYQMTDHTKYSTTVTAIGYGDTSATQQDPGTRYQLQNVNLACIPGDAEIDCGQQTQITANEFASGDGTCEGDSGSSAYEQKNFNKKIAVSFGVLSRGGSTGSTCQGGIYTRTDAWATWLIAQAKQAASDGAYTAPAWTQPPPSTDGGTPPPDSGTTDDGAAPPPPGTLGATCADSSDCNAGMSCASVDGTTYICTQPCDPNGDGSDCGLPNYQCDSDGQGGGLCFPKPNDGSFNKGGGCAVSSLGGKSDPSKPVPWGTIVIAGAWVFAFGVRRRR